MKTTKKIICIISAVAAVTGCSTPQTSKPDEPQFAKSVAGRSLTTGFTGTGIQITFDDKSGQWQKIVSVATAPILNNLPSTVDDATSVAIIKARRDISEYVSVRNTSKRTLETISDSLQKSRSENAEGGNLDEATSQTISQRLVDSITQSSSAILKGTVVDSVFVDAEKRQVKVTVYADRKSSALAGAQR